SKPSRTQRRYRSFSIAFRAGAGWRSASRPSNASRPVAKTWSGSSRREVARIGSVSFETRWVMALFFCAGIILCLCRLSRLVGVGADGVVSLASNVIPREVAHMVKAFAAGKIEVARSLHRRYFPLFRNLFLETNPIPVKAALAMMGEMEEEYRLPLSPMSAKNREVLKATLHECGVLK